MPKRNIADDFEMKRKKIQALNEEIQDKQKRLDRMISIYRQELSEFSHQNILKKDLTAKSNEKIPPKNPLYTTEEDAIHY
jgi:hypothetical protein